MRLIGAMLGGNFLKIKLIDGQTPVWSFENININFLEVLDTVFNSKYLEMSNYTISAVYRSIG